jgi:hypothetical protein
MKLVTSILNKIFGQSPAAPAKASASASPGSPSTPTSAPVIDATAVLDQLAKDHPEKLNWRNSIVDLLKLIGIDSSLAARKKLADELGYGGDRSDTATMNGWLHDQVIRRIAENGGKVPETLLKVDSDEPPYRR